MHAALARVRGRLSRRPGHATVERRRRSARHVHRGAQRYADRARPGPLSRCKTKLYTAHQLRAGISVHPVRPMTVTREVLSPLQANKP